MSIKISDAFPSQYLKCSDLNGKPWDMKIRTVAMEDLGQGNDKETKPVLYLADAQKGLVLNKTNSNTIVKSYGDDTGNWTGKAIQVYPTTTEYQGYIFDAIGVHVVPEAQPEKQPDAGPMADILDGDDPFWP